ncbi:MAG: aldehyde ferredoxin oxidoreductase family protein [Chloroflexi bacterium]|nr:aldehyde ferredoxin oxidoreductase family protein [Chloroflexota bacterium]
MSSNKSVYGYTGRVLHVDLTRQKVSTEDLDMETAHKFVGGMGVATKVLYDEVGPGVEPLGADNVLIFSTGPLSGTAAPCAGRYEVTAKSPLTGILGSGNTGGVWGVELKRAGYDAVIVRGASARPVYVWIDNGKAELRRADTLWGKDNFETSDSLRQGLGEKPDHEIRVMSIGPAGENLVRFADITNEYYHVQGRCGLGAVMGSKKLKAIAVRGAFRQAQGGGQIPVAQPKEFQQAVREAIDAITQPWHPALKGAHRRFGRLGALPLAKGAQRQGSLPGKNFQTQALEGWAEKMGTETSLPYLAGPAGNCYRCPLSCYNMVEVREGKYAGLRIASGTFVAPIFEFGAKCGMVDLPAIWKAKEMCHRLGLDLVSAASAIAFAQELYQRGLVSRNEAEAELSWGNEDAILGMLDRIAYRRGLGDILAEGIVRAAKKLGKGSEQYAYTVKGMEIFAPDPRATGKAWGMGYLDNPRGGDNIKTAHTHIGQQLPESVIREKFGMTVPEYDRAYVEALDIFPEVKKQIWGDPPRVDESTYQGKAALNKWLADLCSGLNSLIVCIFPTTFLGAIGPTHYAKLLSACTGEDVSAQELMKRGERVFNLQRMYNVRCGITRQDDHWPDHFYNDPLTEGPAKGRKLSRQEVDGVLSEYYRLRGWDEKTGAPTPAKLRELGLG